MPKWVNLPKNNTDDTQTKTLDIGYHCIVSNSRFCFADKRIYRKRFSCKIFHSHYADGILYRTTYSVDNRKETHEAVVIAFYVATFNIINIINV